VLDLEDLQDKFKVLIGIAAEGSLPDFIDPGFVIRFQEEEVSTIISF
jgi:hypothetical protein